MKKNIFTAVFALIVGTTAVSATVNPIDGDKKQIKTSESKVTWKAYKVTGSHEGLIDLKEGALMFKEDKLTGGDFVVDMTSINTTDLTGGGKEKFEGHLHSDDFFATAKHDTATLVFTDVKSTGKNSYTVTADLTIKGITKPIDLDVSVYGSKATATMKVDRTKYDIKYGSGSFFDGLGDKAIYDEFDLVVDLQF
ncbi:YceI family protein [Cellulophaga baltica]|uniref:YceI family protein n=1 Tax=Cellulophaga TaxID=104264 RepID=UPI001C07BE8C|nr:MULTISPECIES: YceI family protein [Cellulophaga]MBU2994949.1 YceI family protein [Cellulophaga baltica]MDO6766344.1 YceI family protein [Cellulophaga sp. 1_MG-2023]